MKLTSYISKVDPRSIISLEFDLIICSSGFETRATYLIQNFNLKGKHKIALLFDDRKDIFDREKNDNFFQGKGFELYNTNGDSGDEIFKILDSIEFKKDKDINILIDYSSMTRIWYASVLNYFYFKPLALKGVTIYFSYTGAKFNEPPDDSIPNLHVAPILGYSHLTISNKPTVLIIGLGYETDRAYGLTEYLDAETYLFYTSRKNNNPFSPIVEKNNADLIKSVPEERIFIYDIENSEYTFYTLYNLCERLSKSNRIILAPCGPKPFTILCLIIGHILPDVDVWRISAGKRSIPINRIPDENLIVLKTMFNKIACP
jgi:hypothetical protein